MEFQYLVLFAALSGQRFTKSALGIELKVAEIDRLAATTKLIEVERRGNTRSLWANEATVRWAGEHLGIVLPGRNKAVFEILDLLRTRTDAFLKINRIPLAEFLRPAGTATATEAPPLPPAAPAPAIDQIRAAYLAVSSGAYDARVLLKDLRKHLALPRAEQDGALLNLIRAGEADLYPEDDPMSRDEEDDRAALVLADRRRHVIYLRREQRT
jgi:hypothetical protein